MRDRVAPAGRRRATGPNVSIDNVSMNDILSGACPPPVLPPLPS